MSVSPTIVALSTAPGRAAIAVVRISGPASSQLLAAMTSRPLPLPRQAARRIVSSVSGERLDDALVLWFPGPNSYTGEDCVELHLHGGRAVVRSVISAVLTFPGVRLAEPGEFTRLAVTAGKLTLTQAEAIGDLIDSDTERQRRQAISSLGAGLQQVVNVLREQLLDASALLAAAIDFSDEDDVPVHVFRTAGEVLQAARASLERLLVSSRGAELVRSGARIVIMGAPNAGKSSLLNALVQRDVAIVSEAPGTTRDRIEVDLELDGYLFRLIDTAGLRDSNDRIEQIGITRGLEAAGEADLVLWLQPLGETENSSPAEIRPRSVTVYTKDDDSLLAERGVLSTSVLRQDGVTALLKFLVSWMQAQAPQEDVLLSRARQRGHVEAALAAIDRAVSISQQEPELLAEELRFIIRQLDGLIGRVGVEDVLDQVFARFCIGK